MRYVALLLILTSMGCATVRRTEENAAHPELNTQVTYHASLIEGFETVANADALLSCAETLNNLRAQQNQDPIMGDSITCRQGMLQRDTNGAWGYTYPNGGYMMLQPRQLRYFGLQNGYSNRYGGQQLGPTGDASTTLPPNGGGSTVVYGRKRKIYVYPTNLASNTESLAPKPLAIREEKKPVAALGGSSGGGSTQVEHVVKLTPDEMRMYAAQRAASDACDRATKPDMTTFDTAACQESRTTWDRSLRILRARYQSEKDFEDALRGQGSDQRVAAKGNEGVGDVKQDLRTEAPVAN